MEACIVFFNYVFEKYGYNIREFSKGMCPFQMVSIVRWHVGGFPVVMQQNRHTQDLRKALRGNIGVLYRELWGFKYDFEQIQDNGIFECAACVHETNGVCVMRTPAINTSLSPFSSGPAAEMTKIQHSSGPMQGVDLTASSVGSDHSLRHASHNWSLLLDKTDQASRSAMSHHGGERDCACANDTTPLASSLAFEDTSGRQPSSVLLKGSQGGVPGTLGVSNKTRAKGDPRKTKKKLNPYDMCFVDKWDKIWDKIGHMERNHVWDDDGGMFASSRVICMRHFKTSVVSYAFYKDISRRFPFVMRERNIKRYYHRLLLDVPRRAQVN